jgi:hypothetical protein
MVGQALGDRLPQRVFVIHDQQMLRGFSHLVGLPVF